MDWKRRSQAPEIIDSPETISPERMAVISAELRLVNRFLGGTAACLAAVAPLLRQLATGQLGRPLRVADWGAGSADIPRALLEWGRGEQIPLEVLALDWNGQACRQARTLLQSSSGSRVIQADVFHPPFQPGSVDLVLFSAFLHHFRGEEIVALLTRFRQLGVAWAVINDLHRSRLAYWGIRLLTGLFSHSPEVRHDGPLSVLKGFRRGELAELARGAGCPLFEIAWRWAFRYTVQMQLNP